MEIRCPKCRSEMLQYGDQIVCASEQCGNTLPSDPAERLATLFHRQPRLTLPDALRMAASAAK